MVELKPLDWSDPSPPDTYCSYDYCKAETPFGTLQIEWKSWKDYPSYDVDCFGHWGGSFARLNEAKAAALNWYSTRIEAALAARPPTDEALWIAVEALEEAADAIMCLEEGAMGFAEGPMDRNGMGHLYPVKDELFIKITNTLAKIKELGK